jgi:uncharacterized membrane protein YbjE (DUF340 family)
MTDAPMITRRAGIAAGIDALAIVVFVAIGRRTHDEGGNVIVGAAKVAAPFLIGAALGWLVGRAWRDPLTLATGAVIWLTTVVAGLLLRHVLFNRGTAAPFVIVATATLGTFIMGWRGVARWRIGRTAESN